MIRRLRATVLLATAVAVLFAACNGTSSAPPLTDPTEIVTAALKSTETAKSVHVDIAVDGKATVSMDEALASVALDISGRPCLVYNASDLKGKVGDFDSELVEEFLQALVNNCKATMHINVSYGKNTHHIIEAIFKALGRAFDRATQLDARISGIPSTKGVL